MALLKLVLSSVLFATVLASVNQMDLTGFVGRAATPCKPGEVCPTPGPITGQNISIWHCDGTCTYVFLWCHNDHFQLSFMPPPGAKETHVFAIGGPGHIALPNVIPLKENRAGPYKIRECDSGLMGDPESGESARNPLFPGTIHEKISYNRCGTVSQASTEALFKSGDREYLNELDIVEYLPARNARCGDPAVHLVSHTQLYIKCCSGIPTVEGRCPPPPPQLRNLAECTEKSFTLQCESDVDNERYCCSLSAADDANLDAANVGFYPRECHAVDVTGTNATVSLFDPSPNAQLQVDVGSDASQSVYSFGGPWFQFDRACPSDLHKIQIECTVQLVPKAQLSNYRPSGKGCSAGRAPRSGAGFFQAGQLTLVK